MLFLKLVGVRVLEQLLNLKEYFVKLLTRPFLNGFKSSNMYDRVVKHLPSPLTEPYIAWMVFVSQDCEKFLRVFQYDQPIIHMLWPKMIKLIGSLMSRFLSKRQLLSEGAPKKSEEILNIDVCNKSNCKSLLLPMLVHVQKWSLLVLFKQTARKWNLGKNAYDFTKCVCSIYLIISHSKQDHQASAILTPCKKEGHCFC